MPNPPYKVAIMDTIATSVRSGAHDIPIAGTIDPRFRRVLDTFIANFAAGEEIGACIALTLNGKTVIDLWGGFVDASRTTPWARDTIVAMMSVSKSVAGMCTHVLVDQGKLDPDAPIARMWPDFAAAGKQDLPLRYVLDHRAGLPYLTERRPHGTAYNAREMAAALAAQAPLIAPGTDPQYHVLTQGYLLGEIVRRAAGESLGAFFRRQFADPLGIDYWIGLPKAKFADCAHFTMAPDVSLAKAFKAPDTPEGRFWAELAADEDLNSAEWRSAEIPSANGHGNARAIARLFGALACGGAIDNVAVMSGNAIARMTTEQHHLKEVLVGRHYHQASGVILNSPPWSYMGPSPRAFGHQGAGGAHGFADPDAKIGWSYAMNKFHVDGGGPLRKRLIDATYESL
jgi:CubicO group peptidase (beta-lactamase class C family)